MREIINPSFLRNCPIEVSINVLFRRLESVVHEECKKDLGFSHGSDSKISNGLYEYLYFYSKNRPIDKEMSLGSRFSK